MGWSSAKAIETSNDHYNPNNYENADATWFQKGWWNTNEWGWIYTNNTNIAVKLTKATFMACAGHSNGKYYDGGSGSPTLITYGHGCTFTSDIYVIDASGNHVGCCIGVGNCRVEAIGSYNCAYGGVKGNVSQYTQQTSFGNPAYNWGGNKQWHAIPITYDKTKSPAVPPGGKLMVVIRPLSWFTSTGSAYTGNSALLVMKGDSSNFTSELEPEDDDYIWVCKQKAGDTSKKWYREKKAFLMTNKGWEEMKEI